MPRKAKLTEGETMNEPILNEAVAANAPKKEEAPKAAPVKEVVKEVVKEAAKAVKAKATDEAEMSEVVKRVLKVFRNKEKLYVNSKGGVFSEGTRGALLGDAKLYKNPYFKP